jgi:hypothetical protein
MMWENAPTPEEFLKSLGFDEVHSLDIDEREGATHIHDLNKKDIPSELIGRYDVVLAGGTLEHVFDVANGLRSASRMLADGGYLAIGGPANNWVDHGFYQICPTLLLDYFTENGFDLLRSRGRFDRPGAPSLDLAVHPGEAQLINNFPGRVIFSVVVRRRKESTVDRIPTQELYARKRDGQGHRYRIGVEEPYAITPGGLAPLPMTRFELRPQGIAPGLGAYAIRFHNPAHPASLEGRPFRSQGLVYEDGNLLDWVVSRPEMVAERPGSFCHFRGFVHLTASDGSDPRGNGRSYQIAFPEPYW